MPILRTPLIFGLALVFSYTSFKEPLKIVVMIVSFGAIALDIGAWWLAKAAAGLAPFVIIG